jgi:hypothetical protein
MVERMEGTDGADYQKGGHHIDAINARQGPAGQHAECMEPQGQKSKDGRAGNDGGDGLDRRSVQTESKQSLQHDGATLESGATEREGCPIKRDGTHIFGGTFAQPLSRSFGVSATSKRFSPFATACRGCRQDRLELIVPKPRRRVQPRRLPGLRLITRGRPRQRNDIRIGSSRPTAGNWQRPASPPRKVVWTPAMASLHQLARFQEAGYSSPALADR